MALLKFRVYFAEEDSIYRDIALHHKQNFFDFFQSILKAYEFDNKHQATFYRSNDNWQQGKEITVEKYEKEYKAEPLLMSDTAIGTQIFNTTQKFIFQYDFVKNWFFNIELINVSKEEVKLENYPKIIRKEGVAPSQYGTKGLMGTNKITEVEEKYDLAALTEGFGTEGEDGAGDELSGLTTTEESSEE